MPHWWGRGKTHKNWIERFWATCSCRRVRVSKHDHVCDIMLPTSNAVAFRPIIPFSPFHYLPQLHTTLGFPRRSCSPRFIKIVGADGCREDVIQHQPEQDLYDVRSCDLARIVKEGEGTDNTVAAKDRARVITKMTTQGNSHFCSLIRSQKRQAGEHDGKKEYRG